MKRIWCIFIIGTATFLSIVGQQTAESAMDTSKRDQEMNLREIYLGIGGGLGSAGVSVGINGTLVLPNGFGIFLGRKINSYSAKNLPDDYNGIFRPNDDIKSTSVRILYESNGDLRWGIEAGPAWMNYRELVFTPISEEICVWEICWTRSKNYETEEISATLGGFTVRAKLDFGGAKRIGGEFAVLRNINKYRNFVGFELYLTLGLVNSKAEPKTRPHNR